MSENPFNSPQHEYRADMPNAKSGAIPGLAIVNQVTVVSIMMLVQGGLLLLMSALFFFYAFMLPMLVRSMPDNGNPDEMPPEVLFWITVGGGVGGGFILLLALMHFLAGYWGLNLKGRMFGITTLILGLITCITFYCAPTAIGLAVYGLIIYFNGAAKQAFEMRSQGLEKQTIMSRFY